MTVPCPHCYEPVSVEDAGHFDCPHCGKPFEIGDGSNENANPPPLPKPEVAKRILARSRENTANPKPRFICTACGTAGEPEARVKGSFAIELVVWAVCGWLGLSLSWFLLSPALLYSIWRLASRESVCGKCGGKLIPTDTPAGAKLWEQYHK